ncbi:shikimate dehydrogenase [Oscillochloris sp. ZM17-4]|uniref:shikimate dehydrogenase family protein n=1 Tax=Oscillochloris sp. ZM17-4 TaxID=2866714 RepID=UPI0021069023|nr:shikimate dehydrogenase [Oscillochloris sp. ZM17-4]
MFGHSTFNIQHSTFTMQIILIGDPVAHSRSPAMQNAALAHLGLSRLRYAAAHTPLADLPARVAALRGPEYLGANVTLPHKQAVIALLDDLEPEAAKIGAVNTIYKAPGGALIGANTDAPGLLDDLREGGADLAGRSAVLLGASGAARAAAFALAGAGLARLTIANRGLARAEALAADLGGAPAIRAVALDDPGLPAIIAGADLLINATSLGWQADETPLPDPPVSPHALVYDMVYRETRLLRAAAARGARTRDGAGMLVHQGALALTRWTGRDAPLAVMWAAFVDCRL